LEADEAIEWPLLVLLGGLIPSGALESTGGAARVAGWIGDLGASVDPWITIAILLTATTLLSNPINNAAAAVLTAPVGPSLATRLGALIDPFLMAVAIGASCAFLTPVGHQSNTLVMRPGGYRFGDSWRRDLPVSVIVVLLATPTILYVWPL